MIESRQKAFGSKGFQAVLVIEDGKSGPATSLLCETWQKTYQEPVLVLYDPTKALQALFGFKGPNELNVVLDRGTVVRYAERYADQPDVEAAIAATLPAEAASDSPPPESSDE